MFVAHMPAGYLMAYVLKERAESASFRDLLLVSMSGAVAPDMDLAYFFLIDEQQHNHHDYFSHYPLTWAALLFTSALCWCRLRHRTFFWLAVFAGAAFVHVLLDSVVGGIAWLAPWSQQHYSLWQVSARYQPWWLNFILHPSFLLELLLCATAAVVAWRQCRER